MDKIAEKIISTNLVTDFFGINYSLHSHTSKEQCEVIQQVIRSIKPKVSVETGLAYGISTLFICEALKDVNAKTHIAMDPYQEKNWKNIGLKNIKEAGYESLVDFRNQFAHEVLPQLLSEDMKVDFAYLDASKVFDVVIVNVYYLTRLLNVGGIIVLDDCNRPGIKKVCRFLAKHPSFEIALTWQKNKKNLGKEILSNIVRHVPYNKIIFANHLIESDKNLGVDAHCVGFRKIEEDKRHWAWFQDF